MIFGARSMVMICWMGMISEAKVTNINSIPKVTVIRGASAYVASKEIEKALARW
jgi:hypothetical protein